MSEGDLRRILGQVFWWNIAIFRYHRPMYKMLALFVGALALVGVGCLQTPNPETPFNADPYNPQNKTDGGSITGQCQSVRVDCGTHRITIGGMNLPNSEQIIDCGKNGTTINGSGTIGGRHHGRVVKDGVAIEGIQGMGQSGGGRVFHTAWWRKPPMPIGENGSKGCVRVTPKVLKVLKSCKGAPLTITGGSPERGGKGRARRAKGKALR